MWYNLCMTKLQNTKTHKHCPKCDVLKIRSDFHKDLSRKDGVGAYCKECKRSITDSWRKNNPEKINSSSIWYRRKVSYGVTKEDYEKMLVSQNNECAICQTPVSYESAVDHDHLTGQVRGLLCRLCNQGLGLFRDNKDFLKKAIEYLDK